MNTWPPLAATFRHTPHSWTRSNVFLVVTWFTTVAVGVLGVLGGAAYWNEMAVSWCLRAIPCVIAIALAPVAPLLGFVLPPVAFLYVTLTTAPSLGANAGDAACGVLAALAIGTSVVFVKESRTALLALGSIAVLAFSALLYVAKSRLPEAAGGWFDADQISRALGTLAQMLAFPVQFRYLDETWPALLGMAVIFPLSLLARRYVRGDSMGLWSQWADPAVNRWFRRTCDVVAVVIGGMTILSALASGQGGIIEWSSALICALPLLVALVLLPRYPRSATVALSLVFGVVSLLGVPGGYENGYGGYSFVLEQLWPPLIVVGFIAALVLPRTRSSAIYYAGLLTAGSLWFAGVVPSGVGLVVRLFIPSGADAEATPSTVAAEFFQSFGIAALALAVAGLAGWILRTWSAFRKQASSLEATREELAVSEAQRALADERRGIAGDVHDVLAHSLTVIVAQGEGALVSLPDEKQEALRRMVDVARASLRDVRSLIERLDGEDTALPSPGLDDLPVLLQNVRDAGLRLTVDEFGERATLGDSSELALYRILQEALTNVLTHGGRDASARLTLDWGGDEPGLSLLLASESSPDAPERPGTGLGLAGMRTRAAVAGGWLTAGPDEGDAARTDDDGGTAATHGTAGERPTSGTQPARRRWLVTAHLPAAAEAAAVLR